MISLLRPNWRAINYCQDMDAITVPLDYDATLAIVAFGHYIWLGQLVGSLLWKFA